MALDAFLKIDGIPGESADEAHKDSIEVLGYSFDMTTPIDVAAGLKSGRIQLSPLTIQKVVDKASAILTMACRTNMPIKEVTLELCRATGKKEKYFEYRLSKAHVSRIHVVKNLQSGGLPIEEVSFVFAKIEWTYYVTDLKTGKPHGSIYDSHEWNVNR